MVMLRQFRLSTHNERMKMKTNYTATATRFNANNVETITLPFENGVGIASTENTHNENIVQTLKRLGKYIPKQGRFNKRKNIGTGNPYYDDMLSLAYLHYCQYVKKHGHGKHVPHKLLAKRAIQRIYRIEKRAGRITHTLKELSQCVRWCENKKWSIGFRAYVQNHCQRETKGITSERLDEHLTLESLTNDQQTIVRMIRQGYSQREIGKRLDVSHVTIGTAIKELQTTLATANDTTAICEPLPSLRQDMPITETMADTIVIDQPAYVHNDRTIERMPEWYLTYDEMIVPSSVSVTSRYKQPIEREWTRSNDDDSFVGPVHPDMIREHIARTIIIHPNNLHTVSALQTDKRLTKLSMKQLLDRTTFAND